ncbi:MAG: DUF547 domain-containing protein [Salinibacter sp.]
MPCSSLRFSVTAGALLLVLVPGLAVAQSPLTSVYAQSDSLLDAHVEAGEVDYAALAEHPRPLRSLVQDIEQVSLSSLPPPHAKAFLLNAYNLLAIRAVVEAYPISSPQDVPDFFTAPRVTLAGERRSLDAVENLLFERFPDPRLHFALVCAARSCPALPDSSYRAGELDRQLDRITRQTLRDRSFVRVHPDDSTVVLSKIFDWYRKDFVRSTPSLIAYVNQYRSTPIPTSYRVEFRAYDWSLNGTMRSTSAGAPSAGPASAPDMATTQNIQRFTPSTLIRPGQFTLKLFNNLYTQTAYFDGQGRRIAQSRRSTYFTGILNTYVGLTPTLNAGFELYTKSVRIDDPDSSPFSVLSFASRPQSRTAVTSILPKVKWAPAALRGVVLQLGTLIPFSRDVDGMPFLADGDPELQLRAFYDTSLGGQLLVYLEGGVLARFDDGAHNKWTVPFRGIVNYYPSDRVTLYGLVSASPSYRVDQGALSSQVGTGVKYELLPGVQAEALVTTFPFGVDAGAGVTYNLGLRVLR